jgi:uncharacterized membrane-anchored protein
METGNAQTLNLILGLLLSGGLGKFLMDAIKRILTAIRLPFGAWTVRILLVPVCYAVVFTYSKVTHTPFDPTSINALVESLAAALVGMAVHSNHKDLVAPPAAPPR